MQGDESALVVLAPEAEGLVGPFRQRHDSAAARGVPAHLTVLYPFVSPVDIDDTVIGALESMVAVFDGLRFALTDVERFPGVVYLAPTPGEQIRALTLAVWERFPDWPPYGGQFADVVPHLTCANIGDERLMDEVAGELTTAGIGVLPIDVAVDHLSLLVKHDGRWKIARQFALGGAT